MIQRRTFLYQAGWLTALSVLAPGQLLAAPPARKTGLQLYTLRDYISKDVKGVLAKVAQAGYQTVETYGYNPEGGGFWGLSAAQFAAALKAHGLTTFSGHYDTGRYFREGNLDLLKPYLEAAKACGQAYVVVPYLDEQVRTSPDAFKAIAEKLNRAGELCRAAGLRLGYHNHDFEFKPVGGTTLYEVLLRETQPTLVEFELDLYWAVRAGQNPLQLLQKHQGRFPLWHVKDMDKTQPERNTEVGTGSINFPELFKQAGATGLKQAFVEQENFAMDAYKSITQSAAYVKKRLL
ncbi:sugar phosphate isomerase/epimerase family protein [Hymenobacter weizhouensis]|uniref:sugar phosphate isomerase/epimerase family protein n=1 Tax=Hymenobacter sp. YIM 151500-1 TaxID=2987689 RepID=UPI002226397F|nr:sugar phosphate isomerase/epimerase [Hymenobacter sp. YIM 151500-1]UYZ61663.1 sugar phosphate isomerase/epimerase [Hymenobacter sp. YIM 151500-1]